VHNEKWNSIVDNNRQFVKGFVERNAIDDILFINEFGQVMYTFAEETDLGENLLNGKLKNSGLTLLFKKVLKDKKYRIEDFKSYEPLNNIYACFVGIPFYDVNGKFTGVIAIRISTKSLNNIVLQKVGLGGSGETYLIGMDLDGKTSLRSTRIIKQGDIGQIKTDSVIDMIFKGKDSYLGTKIGSTGNEEFVDAVKLDIVGLNWGLFTTMSINEVLEPMNRMKIYIYTFGLIWIIIIVVISIIFSNAIAKPIKNISSAMEEISRGVLDNTITLKRKDELGILANSYKQLQGNLISTVNQVDVISSGDYNKDIEPHSDTDHLGIALHNMTKKLRETSIENYKQNNIKTFQNELNEKLRGELDINTFVWKHDNFSRKKFECSNRCILYT